MQYLYKFNSIPENEELAQYEMEAIFNQKITSKYFTSNLDISPNKSYFINHRINIISTAESLETLHHSVVPLGLYYENFKIECSDIASETLKYREQLDACRLFADAIDGTVSIKQPKIILVIAYANGIWYFGELVKNDRSFLEHTTKPYSYSNSMPADMARSLVNIATKNSDDISLVDPCCGIGTVVIEALSQNYQIIGTELNRDVAWKAIANLQSLNLPEVISCQDMHTLEKPFDVAILDLPYGLYSVTSKSIQRGLIDHCHNIANELLLLSNEPIDHLLAPSPWELERIITISKQSKGDFTRYLHILKKH